MVLEFPILADYCGAAGGASGWSTPRTAMCYNLQQLSRRWQPGDILLHGHTHVPAWTRVRGREPLPEPRLRLRLPKEGSHHGYMTLEGGVCLWKTLEGETYHELSL